MVHMDLVWAMPVFSILFVLNSNDFIYNVFIFLGFGLGNT